LDSDDVALPERFYVQYKFLEDRPKVFLVGSSAILIDEKDKVIGVRKKISGPERIKRFLKKSNCISHSSVMFRNDKKTFYRKKFTYAHDYDLYLRLLSRNKILDNISRPLIKYRLSKKAISFKKRDIQNFDANQARKFYIERIKTGKDSYHKFNPKIFVRKSKKDDASKILNKEKIKVIFLNNKNKARKEIKLFFKKFGFDLEMFMLYFASFLPQKIINFLRGLK